MQLNAFAPIPYALVAAAGFIATIRNREPRQLRTPAFYLAFVALASIAGGILYLVSPPAAVYARTYFAIQLTHGIILAVVGLEIASQLMPARAVEIVGSFLLVLVVLLYAKHIPVWRFSGLLDMSITADLCAGRVRACWCWQPCSSTSNGPGSLASLREPLG
jgi:hypothetical protein